MLIKKLLLHLPSWLVYLCIIDLLIMGIAMGGRFIFPWQPMTVFKVYYYCALACLFIAVIALVLLIGSIFWSQISGKLLLFVAFVLGALPILAAVIIVKPEGFAAPMIHDVTTDMQEPPEFIAIRSMRQAGENSLDYGGADIAEQQKKCFPDIQPVLTDISPEDALQRAEQTVQALGWTLVSLDRTAMTIEAYDTTPLFGFVDDVSIRIRTTDSGSRLDIRSISRVGLGDLGANAQRVRRFIKEFNSL